MPATELGIDPERIGKSLPNAATGHPESLRPSGTSNGVILAGTPGGLPSPWPRPGFDGPAYGAAPIQRRTGQPTVYAPSLAGLAEAIGKAGQEYAVLHRYRRPWAPEGGEM